MGTRRIVNCSPSVSRVAMNDHVRALAALERGQFVRLTLEDGTRIEGRSNQTDFVDDESIRVELTTDESGDFGRYQLLSRVDGGEWSPVEVRGYDPELDEDEWMSLGTVTEVEPLEEHRMMDSEVDTGHEG